MYHEEYDDDSFDEEPRRGRPFWWPLAAVFEVGVALLADFGAAFVEKAEWTMYCLAETLSFLVMPWRWFRRTDDLENEVEFEVAEGSSSTVRKLNEVRFSILDRTFGLLVRTWEFVGELAERMMPRQLFWPLYWCLDVLVIAYDFFGEWWHSRDFRKLRTAAPAILMAVSLSVSAVVGLLDTKEKKIQRYSASLAGTDLERSSLVKQKLTQLGFRQLDRAEFVSAIALAKAGKPDAAYTVMKSLAPLESVGLLSAHLWIAGSLLDGIITSEPNPWSLVETHVNHALSIDGDNPLAKRLAVEVLVHKGEVDAAMEEMEELSNTYPDLHAALAHGYHRAGDLESGRVHARRAISHYERMNDRFNNVAKRTVESKRQTQSEKRSSESELLTPKGYLRLAEAYHLVDDFSTEYAMLEEAVERYPEHPVVRRVLTLAQENQLKRLRPTDSEFGALVQSICHRDPANNAVVRRLVSGLLADGNSNAVDAKEVTAATWKLIDQLQQEGLLSSLVFHFAGDFYLASNEDEKAVEFYTRTCKLDPKASFAWNNLAAIWSKSEHKWAIALKASNRAIELESDSRFLETRGQIYLKLKQFENAIDDLEAAISGTIPNAVDAHRALIVSYEAIGQREQAEAHRSLLNSFSRNY